MVVLSPVGEALDLPWDAGVELEDENWDLRVDEGIDDLKLARLKKVGELEEGFWDGEQEGS